MAKAMQKIGIIGLGFMGKMHFDTYAAMKGVKVVAIADIDPKKRAGDWSAIGGNIATKAAKPNLRGITMYEKAEDLIADPNVDIVDVILPTYLHERYVLKSLASGKPTLCEKPIARTSTQAKRMVAASKKHKTPLFIGHCLRFWPEYAKAKELIASKKYGRVLQATFTRLSPLPTWGWENWLVDVKKSGSAALDLHVHDADFILYCFGKPKSVSSRMAGFSAGRPDHIVTHYDYGKKNQIITAEGGWMGDPSFPFHMHFNIKFEKAGLTFGCGGLDGLVLHTPNGKEKKLKVAGGDGYSQELDYYLKCIRQGKPSTIVTPDGSALSVALIEAEVKSAKAGGKATKVG